MMSRAISDLTREVNLAYIARPAPLLPTLKVTLAHLFDGEGFARGNVLAALDFGLDLRPISVSIFLEIEGLEPTLAALVRRDVMMPGVWAVRSSSSILSIRYSRSRRWSSPIGCMAALVI